MVATYKSAGVDIAAGGHAVTLMKDAVRATYNDAVLAGIGAFGGMYDASICKNMQSPVLVASTDGVGTKVELAARFGRYAGLGHDIVHHSINDILVQGARPLFFMDYIAMERLVPEQVAAVVTGMAEACKAAGCALLGGETAEMPGVYREGTLDIAGTIIGIVGRECALPHTDQLRAGDVLIGIRSSGPHTNGYSLIRKIFEHTDLETHDATLGCSLLDALLAPHRNYAPLLRPLLDMQNSPIKALVHLTGGGIFENIPRILPDHLGAVIEQKSWPENPLFARIAREGNVAVEEMFRVFNNGIGMLLVVSPDVAAQVQAAISEPTWIVGSLVEEQGVRLG